jgi:hypothetical protein
MQTLKAGAIYFLLVFAVGWVLGPIRELWLVPHLGRTIGSLLEAPLMVIAMILAAGWVLRGLNVTYALNARLAVGLVALGILFVAELLACDGCGVYRSKNTWRAMQPRPD